MNDLKPPFFFIDGDDIGVFRTLAELQSVLEPREVQEKGRFACDAEGHPIGFRVVTTEISELFGLLRSRVERLEYEKSGTNPERRESLQSALVRFLSDQGVPKDAIRHDSLDDLVNRVVHLLFP